MAKSISSTAPKPAAARGIQKLSAVEPLTRRGYKRLAATERQIGEASALDAAALVMRARQRDENAPGYLPAEALIYFIRRADRDNDLKTREALFRELLERCIAFFRGKFRGFSCEDREDLQGDVMSKVVEDVLAPGDSGDFMQVRFWKYLTNKTIDACRKAFRHAGDTESLDTGYSGNDENEGLTKLEKQVDAKLTPEQLATLSEGLATLPPRLCHVFLLRHWVGMKIGSDDTADDDPDDLTLAQHFNCTGRTIRNWLKEAGDLLAGFREK